MCIRDRIKEHGLPVLVLFEGWGTAGKGSVLGKVIKNIDPRFFKVATMDEPTEEERRKMCIRDRFWEMQLQDCVCKSEVEYLRFRRKRQCLNLCRELTNQNSKIDDSGLT